VNRQSELKAICKKIAKIDPAFAPAIKNLAPCTFGLEKPKVSQYQSLIRAVIAQQVSTSAARTISGRLLSLIHI
jgi:3-methyladenine DNA glycosylase/8-oxoguanine DNA glycosylase